MQHWFENFRSRNSSQRNVSHKKPKTFNQHKLNSKHFVPLFPPIFSPYALKNNLNTIQSVYATSERENMLTRFITIFITYIYEQRKPLIKYMKI